MIAPELFTEVGEEQESRCVLMKKQGIFSLGIFPSNESQIWCARRSGKFLMYDLEKGLIGAVN